MSGILQSVKGFVQRHKWKLGITASLGAGELAVGGRRACGVVWGGVGGGGGGGGGVNPAPPIHPSIPMCAPHALGQGGVLLLWYSIARAGVRGRWLTSARSCGALSWPVSRFVLAV